jgi:hypothetical protein
MNEKASSSRQNTKHRSAPSAIPAAPPRVTSHKSRQSPLTNHAFLIDIWRLETHVTRWKHTMRVRSNRHSKETPPIAVFAAGNVVTPPRRVLASRFSAPGVPSPWRNPRVHHEHPPGGGIGMLIPMHSSNGTVPAISTRNACLTSFETRKAKFENRGTATFSAKFEFPISVDRNLRGET